MEGACDRRQDGKQLVEEADLDISHIYRIRRKAIAKLRKWLKADEAHFRYVKRDNNNTSHICMEE